MTPVEQAARAGHEAIRQVVIDAMERHHHRRGPIILPQQDIPPAADAIMEALSPYLREMAACASLGFVRGIGDPSKPRADYDDRGPTT